MTHEHAGGDSGHHEHKKSGFKRFLTWNTALKIIPIIFILFAMYFAFYVRSGQINLEGLDTSVENNIYGQIQGIVGQQVEAQNPFLPPAQKQILIAQQMQQIKKTRTFQTPGGILNIDDIVKQQVANVKSAFQTPDGQTYFTEIDSYHFFKLAENYYFHNQTGDSVITNAQGQQQFWNSKKLAPNGVPATDHPEFHIWVEALMFKLYGINESSTLGQKIRAIFILPAIFAMIAIIPCYFFIRKFSNDLYALLGCLVLTSYAIYIQRTVAGFVDTDGYSIIFPMLIAACILYAMSEENWIFTLIYGTLAGFFLGFYQWAWSGWFMFVLFLFAIAIYVILTILIKVLHIYKHGRIHIKDIIASIKIDVITLGAFIASSFIFTLLIVKQNIFVEMIHGISGAYSGIVAFNGANIWPNVLSSVAELSPASFAQIVASTGGPVIFFLGLLSLVLLVLDYEKSDLSKKVSWGIIAFAFIWFLLVINWNILNAFTANQKFLFLILMFLPVGAALLLSIYDGNSRPQVFAAILLSVWIAGTIYTSLNGVRFILLLGPAIAVGFAMCLYYIGNAINKLCGLMELQSKAWQTIPGMVVAIMLFLFLFMPMGTAATQISRQMTPSFDAPWFEAMQQLHDNSSNDAIITSWWDFGHFFVAGSDRAVTFDGASQDQPQAHWVGKMLLENDEDKSYDMLRMVVCGGNKAFDRMLEYSRDPTGGILMNKLIYQTLGTTNDEKITILKNNNYYNFTDTQVTAIMEKLSCETPRQNFFVSSEDMISKAPVWAHWGLWDFTRKYIYDNFKSKTVEQMAVELKENVSVVKQYVDQLRQIDVQARQQNVGYSNLINSWLAPYPGYLNLQSGYVFPCTHNNDTINCGDAITINMTTQQVTSKIEIAPRRLIYPTAGNKLSTVDQKAAGDTDIVLVPTDTGFGLLLARYPLGGSLFTKMFFMQGYSLEHFKYFYTAQSFTGIKVIIWETQWNQTNTSSLDDGLVFSS